MDPKMNFSGFLLACTRSLAVLVAMQAIRSYPLAPSGFVGNAVPFLLGASGAYAILAGVIWIYSSEICALLRRSVSPVSLGLQAASGTLVVLTAPDGIAKLAFWSFAATESDRHSPFAVFSNSAWTCRAACLTCALAVAVFFLAPYIGSHLERRWRVSKLRETID